LDANKKSDAVVYLCVHTNVGDVADDTEWRLRSFQLVATLPWPVQEIIMLLVD